MKRVVVTGMGAVTPLGLSLQDSWKAALAGQSGIGRITQFDPTGCTAQIAGELKGFEVTADIEPLKVSGRDAAIEQVASKKDARKVGRFSHLAMAAGIEAYRNSGIDGARGSGLPDHRIGTNIGVGIGGLGEIQTVSKTFLEKGFKRISPFFVTQAIPNLAAGQLSILLNLKGPNLCVATACSSSAHAIGESFRSIQRGEADVILAGGAESAICEVGIGGFAAMKALSTQNDEPTRASRPFDVARDGFVMGEGGVVLVLEEYEHAKKRGADIYGEIAGYGLSGDAHHITSPAPQSEGGYRAMEMALQGAGVNGDQIGYVNAHGTSTPAGDAEEAQAIAKIAGAGASKLHVSSTKSMTGHLLGAAGAIEAMYGIMALKHGQIPPTINLDELDPECKKTGMNFTPHEAVDKKFDFVLSNSFGFGGTNSCLLFKRV